MSISEAATNYLTGEKDIGTLEMPESCVVCGSPYVGYLRHTPTRRTKRDIPLFGCYTCKSLFNPNGYREDEEQLERDLQWNIDKIDRNTKATHKLFADLAKAGCKPKRIVDVGGGIGTTVKVAQELGIEGVCYDVNECATNWGRENFGVDIRSELWHAEVDCGPYDLLTCISVLEHLDHPRPVFEEFAKRTKRENAQMFIVVPFVEQDRWEFILDPDPYKNGTPFFDQDVHVTHFTVDGMTLLARQLGATQCDFVRTGLWNGCLIGFD